LKFSANNTYFKLSFPKKDIVIIILIVIVIEFSANGHLNKIYVFHIKECSVCLV